MSDVYDVHIWYIWRVCLFLCADNSCLVFQGKDVIETEKQLNRDFTNICEWFLDRLSIHFAEGKTKYILFSSKHKIKKATKLKISFKKYK